MEFQIIRESTDSPHIKDEDFGPMPSLSHVILMVVIVFNTGCDQLGSKKEPKTSPTNGEPSTDCVGSSLICAPNATPQPGRQETVTGVLKNKQLSVTSTTPQEFIQRTCYEIGELPGKCQRWIVLKNGFGGARKAYDCRLNETPFGVALECAKDSEKGCLAGPVASLQLESIPLKAAVGPTTKMISSDLKIWRFAADECASTPATLDRFRQMDPQQDIKIEKIQSNGSTMTQCIRPTAGFPGECQLYGFSQFGSEGPVTVDQCDLWIPDHGSLLLDCGDSQVCINAAGTSGQIVLVSGFHSWPFPDQDAMVFQNGDQSSTLTIGTGLCD